MTETTFDSKCNILADFYIEYKGADQFSDFFQYCDLGLPLAYAFSSDIVKPTEVATGFIEETFALFLELLGIEEDTGYESLDELTGLVSE
jgi:hypothetical protein